MHTRTVRPIFSHSETHRTKLIIPRISYIYLRSAYSRQCSGLARAPTPPRQKPSDWLTRVTPARRNNFSASLVRNVFVLTRCFPERLKNANLSFRKQLKNDLKATQAGQTIDMNINMNIHDVYGSDLVRRRKKTPPLLCNYSSSR